MNLDFAIKNAAEFHDGQRDKNGDPYILHPLRVMLHASLSTDQERIVAVLHDAVEDAGVSLQWIRAMFGDETAAAIDAISQREDEQRSYYYERVKANPLALKVKFADIADNSDPLRLARLDEATQQRLAAKYRDALVALGYHSTPPPRTYEQGEPCSHPGCINHVTHPCEGCGRIAGRDVHTYEQDHFADANKMVSGAYEQGAEDMREKAFTELELARESITNDPARKNGYFECMRIVRALPTQPSNDLASVAPVTSFAEYTKSLPTQPEGEGEWRQESNWLVGSGG